MEDGESQGTAALLAHCGLVDMSQEEVCFLSQRSSAVKQRSMRTYEDDVSHMAKNIGLILVRSGASDEAYEHDEQRSIRSSGARTPAL